MDNELLSDEERKDCYRRCKFPIPSAIEDELCQAQIAKLKSLGYIKLPDGVEEEITELIRQFYWYAKENPVKGKTMNLEKLTETIDKQILSLIRGEQDG